MSEEMKFEIIKLFCKIRYFEKKERHCIQKGQFCEIFPSTHSLHQQQLHYAFIIKACLAVYSTIVSRVFYAKANVMSHI